MGSLGRKDLDDTGFLQKNIFMVDRHALDTLPVSTTSLDCAWSLEAMMSCFLASSLLFSHLLDRKPMLTPIWTELCSL